MAYVLQSKSTIHLNESKRMMHIIYCHGFASSPGSKKANSFRPYFEAKGATYSIPDLNQPSFEKLTLTAMIAKVIETIAAVDDDETYLIGSSMGGLTALHTYDQYRQHQLDRIKKMVFLAPAFDFLANRRQQMGADWMEKWRTQGEWAFFNYATNDERRVHFGLVEDIQPYDSASVTVDVPVLIYHGRHDETVDYQQSVDFADQRASTDVHLLDSDHQLLDQTAHIRTDILQFFDLA